MSKRIEIPDPECIEPFTNFLEDLTDNILRNPKHSIKFGDIHTAPVRIVVWFKWERGPASSEKEPVCHKVTLMSSVLDRMTDCYVTHANRLGAAGISLYAATLDAFSDTLRMEFLFYPSHIAQEFFGQLAHARTLERIEHEENSAKQKLQNPGITEECRAKVAKCLKSK